LPAQGAGQDNEGEGVPVAMVLRTADRALANRFATLFSPKSTNAGTDRVGGFDEPDSLAELAALPDLPELPRGHRWILTRYADARLEMAVLPVRGASGEAPATEGARGDEKATQGGEQDARGGE